MLRGFYTFYTFFHSYCPLTVKTGADERADSCSEVSGLAPRQSNGVLTEGNRPFTLSGCSPSAFLGDLNEGALPTNGGVFEKIHRSDLPKRSNRSDRKLVSLRPLPSPLYDLPPRLLPSPAAAASTRN